MQTKLSGCNQIIVECLNAAKTCTSQIYEQPEHHNGTIKPKTVLTESLQFVLSSMNILPSRGHENDIAQPKT